MWYVYSIATIIVIKKLIPLTNITHNYQTYSNNITNVTRNRDPSHLHNFTKKRTKQTLPNDALNTLKQHHYV